MSVDEKAVRLALRSQLVLVPGLPVEAKRAYENRAFKPPEVDPADVSAAMWVRETMLPASELPITFGEVQGIGVVQYDVVYPRGEGTEVPEGLAKAIKDQFKPGNSIVNSGVTLWIDESRKRPGREWDENWFFFPVEVVWRTYA